MPLIATAALSYQWVFLKDADTARTDVDTTGLPGIDIPVSGTGSVDPLAAPLSEAPITYTVRCPFQPLHESEMNKQSPRAMCTCLTTRPCLHAATCRTLHT